MARLGLGRARRLQRSNAAAELHTNRRASSSLYPRTVVACQRHAHHSYPRVAWLFALPEAKLLALDKGSHFARFRTAEAIRRGDAQRVQVTERMIICVTSIFLLLPG